MATAAVLALALTIVASVRQRRRELALLKSLGMRRSQLRSVVLSQATTILVVAIAISDPLGIAAGRWAWTAFANAIGVVPAPVVPTAALALGVLALLSSQQHTGHLARRHRRPDPGSPHAALGVARGYGALLAGDAIRSHRSDSDHHAARVARTGAC